MSSERFNGCKINLDRTTPEERENMAVAILQRIMQAETELDVLLSYCDSVEKDKLMETLAGASND